MHVKSKKYALFLDKVEFRGHAIIKDGVSVADVKVSAVCDWPIPKTVRDVQGFLGLANFYRQFIRSFAKIAQPLTSLMKKEHVFEWTEAC